MRFVILSQAGPSGQAVPVPSPSAGITLHESAPVAADAAGVRVRFTDAGPEETRIPFASATRVAGLDEAIAWVRRYPFAQARPEVEIHPVAG